jgi:hypothetical protein
MHQISRDLVRLHVPILMAHAEPVDRGFLTGNLAKHALPRRIGRALGVSGN